MYFPQVQGSGSSPSAGAGDEGELGAAEVAIARVKSMKISGRRRMMVKERKGATGRGAQIV